MVLILCLSLVSLGGSVVHAADETERMLVGDGINTIYRTACQLHCKKRRNDECVRNCFEQYFESVTNDSDDADLLACRQAGGILRERINTCAQAISKIIDLTDETKLSEMFSAMAEVELRCTSQALCEAGPAALQRDEASK